LYQVHAVTQGTDAQAEVSVRLAENGRAVTAKGADPDTLVASAKAYLGALNKLMSRRGKGKPEPMVAERRVHSTDVGRGSGAPSRSLRSSPRKRGPSSWLWIPACAGMNGGGAADCRIARFSCGEIAQHDEAVMFGREVVI